MSNEFKTIETQEQLNEIIGERLRKAEEKAETKAAEKFQGWTSPEELEKIKASFNDEIKKLNEAISATDTLRAEKEQAIAERDQSRADLAKTRIAVEAGIGLKHVGRIQGANEEEWKADAEILAKDFAKNSAAPIGGAEPVMTDSTNAMWAKLASDLTEK